MVLTNEDGSKVDVGQPEVFQLPLWFLLGFVVHSHIPYLLEYVHFLHLLEKS